MSNDLTGMAATRAETTTKRVQPVRPGKKTEEMALWDAAEVSIPSKKWATSAFVTTGKRKDTPSRR